MIMEMARFQSIDPDPLRRVHRIVVDLMALTHLHRSRVAEIEEQETVKGCIRRVVIEELLLKSIKADDFNLQACFLPDLPFQSIFNGLADLNSTTRQGICSRVSRVEQQDLSIVHDDRIDRGAEYQLFFRYLLCLSVVGSALNHVHFLVFHIDCFCVSAHGSRDATLKRAVLARLIKCFANLFDIRFPCSIQKKDVEGSSSVEHLAEWLKKSLDQKWGFACFGANAKNNLGSP